MASFFSRGGSSSAKSDIEVQFDKFLASAPSSDDCLSPTHLCALAAAIDVHEDDVVLYVIAWKLQCKNPMKIARDEWVRGMLGMRLDSLSKLKAAVPVLRNELRTPNNFRSFYNFVFEWVRETSSSKYVTTDTACAMWPILFEGRSFASLNLWLEFFGTVYKKTVSRDLWRQTLDFSQINLEQYDPTSSWPTAMDEFVEWQKTKK